MHRTLKQETARPPASNRAAQQECFDQFRSIYNEQRPHEALGQRTPAELYHPSCREYPEKISGPDYPGHFEVRSVRPRGEIRWQGQFLFLNEALCGEQVGLEETADGVWSVYFGALLLARFDERERNSMANWPHGGGSSGRPPGSLRRRRSLLAGEDQQPHPGKVLPMSPV